MKNTLLIVFLGVLFFDAHSQSFSTLTDSRDGQTYNTVELKDGKIWMAENLNFDVGEGCSFYRNDANNGNKYGRLYTWETAKTACPEGWRLPTIDEWSEMTKHYGITLDDKEAFSGETAYKALIGRGNSGFSALLGGIRRSDGTFNHRIGDLGHYWSSSEKSTSQAWHYYFISGNFSLGRYPKDKLLGGSCRCVQD